MWIIYISLCLGIVIGAYKKTSKKLIKINDIMTLICIFALLFVMGISIGTNKEVINNIGKVGLIALVYSILTILGSIIVVYLVSNILLRGKRK